MPSKPTQRSLATLKAMGYRAKVVERWNAFAKIRQDVFGVDILAIRFGEPLLCIQACAGCDHVKRREKLEAEGFRDLWKGAGVRLEVWSWDKQGPRGKRKVWTLRREQL